MNFASAIHLYISFAVTLSILTLSLNFTCSDATSTPTPTPTSFPSLSAWLLVSSIALLAAGSGGGIFLCTLGPNSRCLEMLCIFYFPLIVSWNLFNVIWCGVGLAALAQTSGLSWVCFGFAIVHLCTLCLTVSGFGYCVFRLYQDQPTQTRFSFSNGENEDHEVGVGSYLLLGALWLMCGIAKGRLNGSNP